MTTLSDFLRTGRLGPVSLGMGPVEVMTALGDPDDTSEKLNPLILKYGPVQLVFLGKPKQRKQDLREIAILYSPKFTKMPKTLRFSDWNPSSPPTEEQFSRFLDTIEYHPVHEVSGESGTQLIFMSGVVALFVAKSLHSIRLTQRETKEESPMTVSDEREPSVAQIRDMLAEADRALEANAPRAALMTAWAGLEAALRRAALRVGGQGRIGVTPVVLLRELFSANELAKDEYLVLENIRQLRTSAAHGLGRVAVDPETISTLKSLTQQLLGPSMRKKREVGYIAPVDAIEAYSILVKQKHAKPLTEFLRSKGLRIHVEENAIGGDEPEDDLQVRKDTSFDELNRLVDEWKNLYQQS